MHFIAVGQPTARCGTKPLLAASFLTLAGMSSLLLLSKLGIIIGSQSSVNQDSTELSQTAPMYSASIRLDNSKLVSSHCLTQTTFGGLACFHPVIDLHPPGLNLLSWLVSLIGLQLNIGSNNYFFSLLWFIIFLDNNCYPNGHILLRPFFSNYIHQQ